LALPLMTTAALAETHIPGGNISGVWTAAGSPYILDGNCVVQPADSLIVQAGVTVLFPPLVRLRIEGQIQALGTAADSVVFTATDTSQGMESLDFLNTDTSPRDSSVLEYCVFRYGVASPSPDPYMHGGGLYIKNSSRLRVSHCTIERCRTRVAYGSNGTSGSSGSGDPGEDGGIGQSGHGGGIYCDNSSPMVTFNVISLNQTGDAWGGSGGNGGSQSSMGGVATGGDGGDGAAGLPGNGGAIYLYHSSATIYGNTVFLNRTGEGHGGNGGIGGSASSYWFIAVGGDGGQGGSGEGGGGGAIGTDSSTAAIINNLIFQNFTGDGMGGGGGPGGWASGLEWSIYGAQGTGGGGYGGDGYAISCTGPGSTQVSHCTIVSHTIISTGQGGSPSSPWAHGEGVVWGDQMSLSSCIIWFNADPEIICSQANYSCIQGGYPGSGNVNSEPLFVSPPLDNWCLSQTAAGQLHQSPCVDAGNPASPLISGTTRTDGAQDTGVVDMGWHYPVGTAQAYVSATLTPHNPPIVVPASGGSFVFDAEVSASLLYSGAVDIWIIITLPDSSQMPVLQRENIPFTGGASIIREDLAQSIPSTAPAGNYLYHLLVRDHDTWQQLSAAVFPFQKLAGEGIASNGGHWTLEGWDPALKPGPAPEYTLHSAYPNPFNPATVIQFLVVTAGYTKVQVYDPAGRLVRTLAEGWREAGHQGVPFDGSNLVSGIYFYRIESPGQSITGKMLLVK